MYFLINIMKLVYVCFIVIIFINITYRIIHTIKCNTIKLFKTIDFSIEELEILKKKNNIDTDAIVVIFSENFNLNNIFRNKTINFSRQYELYFEITTTVKERTEITIQPYNIAGVRAMLGFTGLLFVK